MSYAEAIRTDPTVRAAAESIRTRLQSGETAADIANDLGWSIDDALAVADYIHPIAPARDC